MSVRPVSVTGTWCTHWPDHRWKTTLHQSVHPKTPQNQEREMHPFLTCCATGNSLETCGGCHTFSSPIQWETLHVGFVFYPLIEWLKTSHAQSWDPVWLTRCVRYAKVKKFGQTTADTEITVWCSNLAATTPMRHAMVKSRPRTSDCVCILT